MDDGIYLLDRKTTLVPGVDTALVDIGTGYSLIAWPLTKIEYLMELMGYIERLYLYMSTNFQKFPRPGLTITKIEVEFQWYGKDGYFWLYSDPNPGYWSGTDGYPGPPYKLPWNGIAPEKPTGCLLYPFLNIDGEYYYGSPVSFGTDRPDPPTEAWYFDHSFTNLQTASYTWSVDPSTGQAWTNTEGRKIFYGVLGTSPNVNTCGTAKIMLVRATVNYSNDSYETEIGYKRLDVDDSTVSLVQYSQTPTIKADDLRFRLQSGSIPDRTELALIRNGALVWKGIAWTSDERVNGEADVLAKSQQIMLDHRLIGAEIFLFTTASTINELLSSDPPDPENTKIYDPGGGTVVVYTTGTETVYVDDCHFYSFVVAGSSHNAGSLYFINSWKGLFNTDFSNLNIAAPLVAGTNTVQIGALSDLDANSADTYIRHGTNDCGANTLNIPPDLHGVASTVLSDFFTKLGQEVRYRYDLNGYTYQDAAAEIANGSAASPLRIFRDGHDCTVSKRIPATPNTSALVGVGLNPRVVSSWEKTRTWISSVFSNSRTGEYLSEWLETKQDDDTATYQILVYDAIWHMRTGDYIAIKTDDEGIVPLRIQQIATYATRTMITAGKRLTALNEQFGTWRGIPGSIREIESIISTAIASNVECATSTSFSVSASNISAGGWQCKVSISWGSVITPVLYGASKVEATWDILYRIDSNPAVPEAYVMISGESYTEHGAHEYEFQITQNMTACGIDPYGTNDVEVLTVGKFKWRKDGGAWSADIDGYDVWHPTSNYNADLGNGLRGRVIFSCEPSGNPWVTPVSTDISSLIGYAWACSTVDLTGYNKFLILKIGGKAIAPGRFAAVGNSGSMEVDITEYCNAAGSYTLTADLMLGLKKSVSRQYYHTLSGNIEQFKRIIKVG